MRGLIGRGLQMIGLVILPVGLMYGLLRDEIRTEVRLLAAGGAIFLVGWLLSKTDRR
jgi:hypothetical protein